MVELLVVIVIISVLLTIATVGLGNMGGNPVNAGVATAEAVFDEARATAVGKGVRAGVLVAKSLENNSSADLRQLFVVHEEIDPATGTGKKNPDGTPVPEPKWTLSSRGVVLPEGVFFSANLSKVDHSGGSGTLKEISNSDLTNAKPPQKGNFYLYQFNGEGICSTPGASFVIGRGARNLSQAGDVAKPRITASSKKDFGGFVIWRNGRTSTFNNPTQISLSLPSTGGTF